MRIIIGNNLREKPLGFFRCEEESGPGYSRQNILSQEEDQIQQQKGLAQHTLVPSVGL